MMAVSITTPYPDQVVPIGATLLVAGLATGRGMPEPTSIESVSVQVDGGSPVVANVHLVTPSHSRGWVPTTAFHADIDMPPGPAGLRGITVRAFDDSNAPAGSARVDVNYGGASFSGSAYFKTSYPEVPEPFDFPVSAGVVFDTAAGTIRIVSFPPIDTGNIPLPDPLGSDDVTVSLDGGGAGAYDVSSGSISIVVDLLFHHSNDFASDSKLGLFLTTGSVRSSHGTFSSHGQALQPNGSLVLVGAGTFNGGTPLGGWEALLELTGTVSPHP